MFTLTNTQIENLLAFAGTVDDGLAKKTKSINAMLKKSDDKIVLHKKCNDVFNEGYRLSDFDTAKEIGLDFFIKHVKMNKEEIISHLKTIYDAGVYNRRANDSFDKQHSFIFGNI